jgi:imidazoleglycerol-phosphate dehydratase/histidinol-phosphatase
MKKILFIDRDGTLIVEPPESLQIDTLDQLEFLPNVIRNLYFIRKNTDFELVMVSNQDGLGTPYYPIENFNLVQQKLLKILKNETIEFDKIFIDPSLPEENSPNRKPQTGMLTEYLTNSYDIKKSFVIGDRQTDVELAKNLGCKAILINNNLVLDENLKQYLALVTTDWNQIAEFLFASERCATVKRTTKETSILVEINLDGNGTTNISTGLSFFNHLLDQIGRHAGIDLTIKAIGDLYIDEHHTIEDTAIALGEAIYKAIGDKRGTERYGFCLPMDDCLCTVALDFGGRSWLVWNADFRREYIGDMPSEMFPHFFKTLSDAAKMNLNIHAEGDNEHHKIEGIFKALAKAIKMAIRRDIFKYELPTTKGIL